jgi:hypothetical protein
MRKFIWTVLLAVSALVVTFAAGSALQIVAEANTPTAADSVTVVNDNTGRHGAPPRAVSLRERIVSAVRGFRDGKD